MSNFTATDRLFLNNLAVQLWRFEVVYTFTNETSTSALNFVINQSPSNGSCVITPHNGTTSTTFTVICPNWYDEDGIKDYSLYGTLMSSEIHRIHLYVGCSLEKRCVRNGHNCILICYSVSTSITSWR